MAAPKGPVRRGPAPRPPMPTPPLVGPNPPVPPQPANPVGGGLSGLMPKPAPPVARPRVPGGIPGLNQMRRDLASPRSSTMPKMKRGSK